MNYYMYLFCVLVYLLNWYSTSTREHRRVGEVVTTLLRGHSQTMAANLCEQNLII